MSEDTFVFKVDIDKNLNWNNCQIVEKKNLPDGYFPSKDALFEKEYCSNYQKLWIFIHSETTQPPSGGFFVSFKNEKNSPNTEGVLMT